MIRCALTLTLCAIGAMHSPLCKETIHIPTYNSYNILLYIMAPYDTRVIFYVRREVDLMKTANVNAYIMHIFGKIELLSIHAT